MELLDLHIRALLPLVQGSAPSLTTTHFLLIADPGMVQWVARAKTIFRPRPPGPAYKPPRPIAVLANPSPISARTADADPKIASNPSSLLPRKRRMNGLESHRQLMVLES